MLTVFGAAEMSERGRRRIAAWLRRQADYLEEDGGHYARRFIARYLRQAGRSARGSSRRAAQ
jgi:hypothetical protein